MTQSSSIIVVGSINTDMVACAQRIPTPGETIKGDRFTSYQGGKGANQAVAARRCGAHVAFIGRIGADALGDKNLQNFKDEGIDVSFVRVDRSASSGVALIIIDVKGENAITVIPGANDCMRIEDLDGVRFDRFDIAVFQLEIPVDIVWAGLKCAKAAGACTLLTPAPATILPGVILPLIDFLVPNEHEVRLLLPNGSDMTSIEAAMHLVSQGVGTVLLTLGDAGVAIVDKAGVQRIPAFQVRAVDTVGAGDCFSGVFATRLAEGASVADAVRLACAAAALSVQRRGAQISYPSRAEAEAFCQNKAVVCLQEERNGHSGERGSHCAI